MKNKIMKVLMVLFMIFGIIFAISNFYSTKLEAAFGFTGSFVNDECFEPGSDCDINYPLRK